jgi:hypothetical protein
MAVTDDHGSSSSVYRVRSLKVENLIPNALVTVDSNKILQSVASSGWTTLVLGSSWQGTAEFILVGPVIFMNGVLNKASKAAAGETIATIPTGYRPSRTMRFETVDSNIPSLVSALSKPYLEVDASGKLSYGNYGTIPNTTTGLILTNVMFPIV